ncbi:calcium uniporter protein, mitochondrial-like [Acipenser oxyrinchus oxyrinchus]|uniref:Calcium uniporter protein n=1 Tax=Acipenser oxyrinchus oxyrinchus TaxID=40147 RepID=A0AAD8GIW4_ACIOX|nr:calcium uniporter protein, mitochondrial-like [Acipenser oxyrinchus oxyrinchus]
MVWLGSIAKLQVAALRRAFSCAAVKTSTNQVKILSQVKCSRQLIHWGPYKAVLYSTQALSNDIMVEYRHGLPMISLPLPSWRERCRFSIKPMLMTVGDFLQDIRDEDKGVDRATILSLDGVQVSVTTPMDVLLMNNFQLLINDITYNVHPPVREKVSREHVTQMEDVKAVVHSLHVALHLPTHQLLKERELLDKLADIKQQLHPLEEVKGRLIRQAEARTTRLLWAGLAILSVQGGALSWLTWWVYSWDIMEPVTYFITYGSAIGFYSYFVLTKQDYVYPDSKDRQFLHYFYRGAKRQRFDVEKYNKLREELAMVEQGLKRLREPLELQQPIQQIEGKE